MKKYDKVLFVSRSDTCRGPMAEAIMQDRVLLEDILVDSKGMIVLFPEPVNQKAQVVLAEKGLSMEGHEAVQFTKDDFDERTLILTMEEAQKKKILGEYPQEAVNLYTLAEYSGNSAGDIFDPLGRDLSEYGTCFDILKEAVDMAVNVLFGEEETLC